MTIYKSPFPDVEKQETRGVFATIFENNPKWKDDDAALIDANTGIKVRSMCMNLCVHEC